jgi:hypothetical protein
MDVEMGLGAETQRSDALLIALQVLSLRGPLQFLHRSPLGLEARFRIGRKAHGEEQ